MKLLKKCAAVFLTAMLATSLFIACGDEGGDTPGKEPKPEPQPTGLTKPTFSPTAGYVPVDQVVSLKSKEKGDIYYEIVKGAGKDVTATITPENCTTVGTKYSKVITIKETVTIFAYAVKDGEVSPVAKSQYKIPVVPADADVGKLHDMILPAGTGATIPAWGKNNPVATDLDPVVTGFTTPESNYTVLNGKTNRTKKLHDAIDAANAAKAFDDLEVKNVIVVFTDGWGESGVVSSKEYYNNGVLTMDHLPYHAPVNHDSFIRPYANSTEEKYVWKYDVANNDWNIKYYDETVDHTTSVETTDSTAGGSAINTGFTTYYSACAVDTNGTEVASLLELARQKGMLVGNVTNDWLTDATPATVGIHSPKRKDSEIINGRMFIASPDWTMGNGGFTSFLKATPFTNFSGHEYSAAFDGMSDSMLKQWYTANTKNGKLQSWAAAMLKEYDGKTVDASKYDINKSWKTDRKLQQFGTFAAALTAIDADDGVRPLVSFDKSHKFEYTPGSFSKVTGQYAVAPSLGYKLGYGNEKGSEETFPNFAEMVASTIYALDAKAQKQNRGFFAFIENTCSDGWGHAQRQYDVMNETQMTDEAVAIAAKYVLENPNTLMIVCADHETGGVDFSGEGWEKDYTKIKSTTGGHSSRPTPLYAFGASANKVFGDIPAFSTAEWTATEKAAYAMGTIYNIDPTAWTDPNKQECAPNVQPAKGDKYPKILRNRQEGIRIAKAMGFDHFGDLNGNGLLDADESDSVVDVAGTKIGTKKITRN